MELQSNLKRRTTPDIRGRQTIEITLLGIFSLSTLRLLP